MIVNKLWCALFFASQLALAASCGSVEDNGPGEKIPIGFRMHELECTIEGKLEAKMQVAGIEGFCPLDVAEDRTVSGLCGPIPTGDVRMFRLIYFVMIDDVAVEVATVLQTVDLTGETRKTITVEFPSDNLVTDELDSDGDQVSNIEEVCTGRDPLIADR